MAIYMLSTVNTYTVYISLLKILFCEHFADDETKLQ